MKVLRYIWLVLGICCFALAAEAQEEVLPEFLSGRQEVKFEWCPIEGDVLYRMCTMQYDSTGEEFFYDSRCSEWSPETTALSYPQLCREFVATLEVCPLDGNQSCYWAGLDSEPYILLPDFDGNGVTALGDWIEFLLGWDIRWGVADYACLANWWHIQTPPLPDPKPPLLCAGDIQ